MSEIETLSIVEHAFLTRQAPNYVWGKLVRIHDAQAARIALLDARLAQSEADAVAVCDEYRRRLGELHRDNENWARQIYDAGARIAELEAKLADRNLWEPGYNELAERVGELQKDCEDYRSGCMVAQERVRVLEAKETTRNAARLAELASGTVSRTEYDAMCQQRDTIRQERTEARDSAATLRDVIGDVHAELVKIRDNPGERWRLDEAIATADLDGYKYAEG